MIPFFRKIRKKMADDNKPIKYLRYAVGEIVLVVIGILIALQINNWNQNRIEKEELTATYKIIEEQITADTLKFNQALKYYEEKRYFVEGILNNSITKEQLEKYQERWMMTYTWVPVYLKNNGFIHLSSLAGYKLEDNGSSINQKLEGYYSNWNQIEQSVNLIQEVVNKNFDYWERNIPWFHKTYTKTVPDSSYEYLLNNDQYRNELLAYHIVVYQIYIQELEIMNQKAKEILLTLKEE